MGLATRNYDIVTRLAVGNGALVYRAVEKTTQRNVALKLLMQDEDVEHRFHADALLADAPRLKQITGAHVCQLIDAFKDEDGSVLVYEFALGMTGAELPSERKLDAAQVVDVAAQLISALRSGERQKTPHGDVKPSNLIFMELADKRPFMIVLDWALTSYRAAVAEDTLPFLAPERLAGAPASHRADLFSAGAAIFYLATGRTLVGATKRADAEAAWPTARPLVLGELRPDLPPKFVQWLCTLVELTPEKRPESAVDAFTALAALNPPPPPVPPESFRARPVTKVLPPIPSGIVKPPAESAKPASAIRQQPPSGIRTAPPAASPPTAKSITPARSATAPVKNSHVAMTVGLFCLLAAIIGFSVWYVFVRDSTPKYPGEGAAERATASAGPLRTPPPSVGADIGRKITPPPPVSVADAKKPRAKRNAPAPAAQPPADRKAATPKPAAKKDAKPKQKPDGPAAKAKPEPK